MRVWAPAAETVAVRVRGRDVALEPEGLGVWSGSPEWEHGDDYWVVLDGRRYPDPCSRWQPKGLRGPSRLVDPSAWTWTAERPRVELRDLVLYELHVGTFTHEGQFEAAIRPLRALRELGITAIELMPVAAFGGERGWGYDAVYPWSAHAAYGGPDGLQRLVDAAHAEGLAVVLDVVPNHVGASGEKALRAFGPYFTDRYSTFWGDAINYDDEGCGAVREWMIQACEMWVRDLRVDGLRLDAVHAVFDQSPKHVLAELAERVDALVIAESGLNDPQVLYGWGHDAQWADDFHHALHALLTGERDGYYADFGAVAHLAKAFETPFVYDGGYSAFRGRRHGAPVGDAEPERFVAFAQNHDQVGNRALGDRLAKKLRPLALFCTLLSPYTPLLFMGEEYGEDATFQFFTDHIDKRIATATREGRRREFASFASFSGAEVPDPQDPATFERSKLTWRRDRRIEALVRELLAVRKTLPAGPAKVVAQGEDWLRVRRGSYELVMNFGRAQTIATPRRRVALSTAPATVQDGGVRLRATSGALLT